VNALDAFNLALVVVVLGAGVVVARRTDVDAKLRSFPLALQAVVVLVATGPLWLSFEGALPNLLWGVIDDSTVALTLFATLWIGLTLLVSRLFGGRLRSGSTC
jgi:hypothetical protein